MSTPSNVKELFLPLAERLNYFESSDYINKVKTYFEFIGEQYQDAELLMDTINVTSNLFNQKEILGEAILYRKRVETVLAHLEQPITEYRIDCEHSDLNIINLDDEPERKKVLHERHMEELNEYRNGLDALIKTKELLKDILNNEIDVNQQSDIKNRPLNLPDKLGVRAFKEFFESKLTIKQTALFLNYFIDAGIMPPYNNRQLGRLGLILFAKDEQNVRATFSDLSNLKGNKDDLKKVKDVLQSIVESIDVDLAEFK